MVRKRNLWLVMLLLPILMAITSGDLYSSTCTGSDPCNACKNCKYCKHCAKATFHQRMALKSAQCKGRMR